ncbi:hypothetical protein IQ7_09032 [Streptococcus thermophilus MTCC 5461]|nr:hypothetical protein IQ7_09032 [Streptococcus thermophilus MTCC 5461]
MRLEYGKAVISYQTSYRAFTKDILITTHYLMVLVMSFASSAIVEKSVIQKIMSKIEGKSLYLTQFKRDPKMLITELE